MKIDLFSFIIGFSLASIFAIIFVVISVELRKKRALAFVRRFAVISEGLSSLKALSFRMSGQLRQLRGNTSKISANKLPEIKSGLESLLVVFDTLSAGMMPPTEEIALEAIEGRGGSAEERAFEDSKKFRDDIRWLRQQLENEGLQGLHKSAIMRQQKTEVLHVSQLPIKK